MVYALQTLLSELLCIAPLFPRDRPLSDRIKYGGDCKLRIAWVAHLFEAAVHNPDFLPGELGLPEELLEGDWPSSLLPGPRALEVEKCIFRSRRVRRCRHSWSALPSEDCNPFGRRRSTFPSLFRDTFTATPRLIHPSVSSSTFSWIEGEAGGCKENRNSFSTFFSDLFIFH